MIILSTVTAMAPGTSTLIAGSGGATPYTYSVEPGGAGGTIDDATGLYSAPQAEPTDVTKQFDTLVATDSMGSSASVQIFIASPLGLVCEIIQHEMNLANGRVYFWDQKIMQPTDSDLYIAVGVLSDKPFGNPNSPVAVEGGMTSVQTINTVTTLSIDVISRSLDAVRRRFEVLMALASTYAQSQQELNSFSIGKLPPGSRFVNLSTVDGAAIPYRFNININMQYFARKVTSVPFYDQFDPPSVSTES